MTETDRALDRITDRVLDIGVAQVWERIAPLSTGAVASSVVIVAGGAVLRRAFRMMNGRSLAWIGLAATVPVSLWILTRPKQQRSPLKDEVAHVAHGSSDVGELPKA